MKADVLEAIEEIKKSMGILAERRNLTFSKERLEEIHSITGDASFWNDPKRARVIMKERQLLENFVETYTKIEEKLNENIELIKLGSLEKEQEIVEEAERELFDLREEVLNEC